VSRIDSYIASHGKQLDDYNTKLREQAEMMLKPARATEQGLPLVYVEALYRGLKSLKDEQLDKSVLCTFIVREDDFSATVQEVVEQGRKIRYKVIFINDNIYKIYTDTPIEMKLRDILWNIDESSRSHNFLARIMSDENNGYNRKLIDQISNNPKSLNRTEDLLKLDSNVHTRLPMLIKVEQLDGETDPMLINWFEPYNSNRLKQYYEFAMLKILEEKDKSKKRFQTI
jgi:hypothetical protein